MIDLHCHLLPGLDDGAENLDVSLQMASQLVNAGFNSVFVTPHVIEGQTFLEATRILEETANFQRELDQRRIALKIHPGGEHYIFPDLAQWLQTGKLLTLGGTGKFILVELPMLEIPSYCESVFFELQVQGVTPILAHPERNHQLSQEPSILYEWLSKGVLYQVNLKSLIGHYGQKAQETAIHMLQCGLVHFIGSDAHRPSARPHPYQQEIKELEKYLDSKALQSILQENPQAILDGRTLAIDIENFREWPHKKSWKERLFGMKRRK